MPIKEKTLEKILLEGIPDATVKLEDLRGDQDHYAVYITSPAFAGKSRIEQHRMVHKAMAGTEADNLHALAIHTSTPEEK